MYPVSNYVWSQSSYSFSVYCFSFSLLFFAFSRLRWIEDDMFLCVCAPSYFFTMIWFLTYFIFTYKFHLANTVWTRKSLTDFALSNEAHVLNVIIFIDVNSLKQKSCVLFRCQENEQIWCTKREEEGAEIKMRLFAYVEIWFIHSMCQLSMQTSELEYNKMK